MSRFLLAQPRECERAQRQVTITKDDWLIMSGKRKRGGEVIAFSERFKLPPNINYTGVSPHCITCMLRFAAVCSSPSMNAFGCHFGNFNTYAATSFLSTPEHLLMC